MSISLNEKLKERFRAPAKTSIPKSIAAGALIAMGCIVNLKAGGGIPGAVLFSAGLWFVVSFDAQLFTGRVAKPEYSPLQKLLMLAFNLVGAFLTGLLAGHFLPEISGAAQEIMAKYSDPLKVLWQGTMCGACMFLATAPPKVLNGSRLPHVIYGVTLFILSAYAHSIALMGYAGIALDVSWWLIPVAALGNTLGSYVIKLLLMYKYN
ncbi:MAG: formate/nitrite transporter family protein [Clostridiales bacterium]|nr:formate/nitrite transporter family protein [Clostridiales bacterium]